jgi:hypothetical protein
VLPPPFAKCAALNKADAAPLPFLTCTLYALLKSILGTSIKSFVDGGQINIAGVGVVGCGADVGVGVLDVVLVLVFYQ